MNAKSKRKESPLHVCVKRCSPELVEYLLRKGANVNDRGSYDETPIYTACKYESLEKLRLLLEYGADIDMVDEMYLTPFYWITYKNLSAGQILMRHMARLMTQNGRVHSKDLEEILETPELYDYYTQCTTEVEKMDQEKFFNKFSFFDLLLISHTKLVKLVRNRFFVSAFRSKIDDMNFIIYGPDLQAKMDKAEEKYQTLLEIQDRLQDIFVQHLPITVIEQLSKHLELEDLPKEIDVREDGVKVES